MKEIKEQYVDKSLYSSVNLYFQDESRFGLMTCIGKCIAAKGVQPIVKYQHRFKNVYLWGAYSPIDGDDFVWETDAVNLHFFQSYLNDLSKHRPNEFKIMVIDNAGFHATKNIEIPNNIFLLNIPPYSPELNPCEQIWKYIKQRFRNHIFDNIEKLKLWLKNMVDNLSKNTIQSICSNHHYLNAFNASFYN